MLYLITNVLSILSLLCLFLFGFFLQKRYSVKIFTTLNIATLALFSALSVILTNVVGYSYIFGMQMMLGNFLIFLTGLIFGPLLGLTTGIITDTIGALINLGGTYHVGFMLIKGLLGFAGGLVFIFKNNYYWKLKTFLIFSFAFILTAILSPIFLYTLYGFGYTVAKFITRIIKLPFELALYNFLIYFAFKITYWFILVRRADEFWCLKNGSLKVRRKKSLREKYQVDLYGERLRSKKETTIYYQQINYNNSNKNGGQ